MSKLITVLVCLEAQPLEPGADGTRVWGSHFPSPQILADHIAPDVRRGFALVGRHGDLIEYGAAGEPLRVLPDYGAPATSHLSL